MRDLIILASCVHGAEMVEIVERINRAAPTYALLGFIVAEKQAAKFGREINGCPVLGTREVVTRYPEALFAPDPAYRETLDLPPHRIVSVIDPSSFVSRTARIGIGCVIYPQCFVGLNAVIGNRVSMLSHCTVNHDDVIEDDAEFSAGVTLAGFVHVEAGCYLGQSCTVRQFLRIGRGSLVGMGAVVVRDVPPNSVMVGNPAHKLRDRVPDQSRAPHPPRA